jgi:CMP-N,N'-diacetyllegionaminic acid synthase
VCEPSSSPFKSFSVDRDGYLVGHFGRNAPFSRRQDFPDLLAPNGAIYVFSAAAFRAVNQVPRAGLIPYPMSGRESVDIDSPEDLALAEFYLNQER